MAYYRTTEKGIEQRKAKKTHKNYKKPSKKKMIFSKFGYKCAYCGRKIGLTVDHVIPKAQGGGNEISNLLPCCRRCNEAKGCKSLDAFKRIIANLGEVNYDGLANIYKNRRSLHMDD